MGGNLKTGIGNGNGGWGLRADFAIQKVFVLKCQSVRNSPFFGDVFGKVFMKVLLDNVMKF